MSISKAVRWRGRKSGRASNPNSASENDNYQLPTTVSKAALLSKNTDHRFRVLVYDLLTISARMNAVREHLARLMNLSGPQYSLLMAIGQFQSHGFAGVGSLARLLHVSSAFVATETGKLVQAGLIKKRPNPRDRRAVLLELTAAGRERIESSSAEIQAVNDAFFGSLDRASFAAIAKAAAVLVQGSHRIVGRLNLYDEDAAALLREAAE